MGLGIQPISKGDRSLLNIRVYLLMILGKMIYHYVSMLPEVFGHTQGNSYSISAKTASYFIVYSCVASSLACMTKTGYFPASQVSTNDLRIACKDVEWDFGL